MPHVVIIGNSGAARECYWIFQDMLNAATGLRNYYTFRGFLDWKGYQGELKELSHLHLTTADNYDIQPDDLFVIGVGKPSLRKSIFETFKSRGATFMNLVHPWTDICPSARMDEGNVFQRGCTVYCNAELGNGNYINGAANLSHDARMGDFNSLGPYTILLGGASIGFCNHLGPHSVVLEHARVGDGNLLSPGCVVYKHCGSRCRMAGNPALRLESYEDTTGEE